MNKLITFLESSEQSRKAKFVGFIAALCALFISITPPENADAKTALAVIQFFWLVLLTVSLTSLFYDFLKYIWHTEKVVNNQYDLPFSYIFTATIGAILGGVVLNLWRYIIDLYADVLAQFTVLIGFPGGVAIGCVLLAIFIEKNKGKIPPILSILADSIILGVLVGVAGMYIEVGITKFFYLFWFTKVAPTVASLFFVFVVLGMLHCGRPLWSKGSNPSLDLQ